MKTLARRLAAVAVAVGLVVSFAPSASADEALTCSIVAPATVAIEAPYTKISARVDAACVRNGFYTANWELVHRFWGPATDVFGDGLYFSFWYATTDSLRFYDTERMGTYDLDPRRAQGMYDLEQNRPTMVVRLGSRLSLTSSRSGSYVTLNAAARRYSPSYDRFASWQNKPIALQSRTSTGAWKTFKTVTSNAKGVSTHRYKVSSKRSYRAVTSDQTNSWGRVSNTVAR